MLAGGKQTNERWNKQQKLHRNIPSSINSLSWLLFRVLLLIYRMQTHTHTGEQPERRQTQKHQSGRILRSTDSQPNGRNHKRTAAKDSEIITWRWWAQYRIQFLFGFVSLRILNSLPRICSVQTHAPTERANPLVFRVFYNSLSLPALTACARAHRCISPYSPTPTLWACSLCNASNQRSERARKNSGRILNLRYSTTKCSRSPENQ